MNNESDDMNDASEKAVDTDNTSKKIVDTDNTSNTNHEIGLYFEFDRMDVRFCSFKKDGDLILSCKAKSNFRWKDVNLVCVYSIETKSTKCQKIYMVPLDSELISITNSDKVWLRHQNNLYEWNLRNTHTTVVLKNLDEVNKVEIITNSGLILKD